MKKTLCGLAFLGFSAACGAPAGHDVTCPATPSTGPSVGPSAAAERAAPAPLGSDEVTKVLIAKIDAGDAGGAFAMFDAEMQKLLPVEKLAIFFSGVLAAKGKLGTFQKKEESNGATKYIVTAERGQWTFLLAVKNGQISGLRITDAAAEPPVARVTAPIGLPFRGEWLVAWGGETAELNHHVLDPSQRRALDLLKVGADGRTFANDGKKLTDYFAYGADVVAVADGIVIQVIDGVPDSIPGELNPYSAVGNNVLVQHEERVFSMYAHLIPNKTKVKVGARVRRGDVLGQCGNSGNSSEPHLHFQLQDGPRMESSWGIEAVFSEVKLAGVSTKNHVAVKNEKLSPP